MESQPPNPESFHPCKYLHVRYLSKESFTCPKEQKEFSVEEIALMMLKIKHVWTLLKTL